MGGRGRLQTRTSRALRGSRGQLFVLLGLTGFAISQPLLSLFGKSPTFFAYYGIEQTSLVWFALGLALVPPLVLWLLGVTASAVHAPSGEFVHLAIVGALVALFVVQALKGADVVGAAVVLATIAIAAGVSAAVAYRRFDSIAMWLQFTAILPLVALALFLFTSDSSDLLRAPEKAHAAANGDAGSLPSVVMVVFDAFPTQSLLDQDGGIDSRRFPNVAAFANDATWYRNFSTVAPITFSAVPALLTGRDPEGDPSPAPLWTNYPENLFSLLAPTHHLTAFESPTKLCGLVTCSERGPEQAVTFSGARFAASVREAFDIWRERISFGSDPDEDDVLDEFQEEVEEPASTGLPAGTAQSSPATGPRPGGVFDPAKPARLIDFVATFAPSETPTLYFLHLLLPHPPAEYYANGTRYAGTTLPNPGNRQPWLATLDEYRFLIQAQYTDQLFGDVVEGLQDAGVYDDSLVVMVADHGLTSAAGAQGGRDVTEAGLPGVAYSPFLVKAPGQHEGVVDDQNLLSIDVLPTVADRTGVTLPWPVDGRVAGDSAIARRGNEKYIYDYRGLGNAKLYGIRRFDDREIAPSAANRWIGAEDPEPLDALHAFLDLDDVIGRPIDALTDEQAGTAKITGLPALRDPPANSPPPAFVIGTIDRPPADAQVGVAVNGTVVTGSPVFTLAGQPGQFNAMLPPGVLADADNDIRLVLVTNGDTVELAVD